MNAYQPTDEMLTATFCAGKANMPNAWDEPGAMDDNDRKVRAKVRTEALEAWAAKIVKGQR